MKRARVLSLATPREVTEEFARIGVDWGGVAIMRSKGIGRLVKVEGLRVFAANILKQEMLSLGADAALARGCLTGQVRTTDCLLIGNEAQFVRLIEKLRWQPFGLARLGAELKDLLARWDRPASVWRIGGRRCVMGRRTWIMGVINVTPDSFSGDGWAGRSLSAIVEEARRMVHDGADLIDIGGESTRPGARSVSAREERSRVVPVVRAVRRAVKVPLSVDTMKSAVAEAALDAGADIVNDVSALKADRKMARAIARARASVILMHMQGTPRSMQKAPFYADVMGEIHGFLAEAIARAEDAGIARERISVDPGIGFGKTFEHNREILRRLRELRSLGRPVTLGLSRKAFIGKILGAVPGQRVWGTAGAASVGVINGADVMRVHDVRPMAEALKVVDALTR